MSSLQEAIKRKAQRCPGCLLCAGLKLRKSAPKAKTSWTPPRPAY